MKPIIYILAACLGLSLTRSVNGQTAAADNKVSESITYSEPPKGRAIYGVFEGRSPCTEISRLLGADMPTDCDHLKWQLILFRDTVNMEKPGNTMKPATYSLRTEMFGYRPLLGAWKITRGTKTDPAAIVYELNNVQPGKSLYLLKGDENVLFILDGNRDFLTGDRNWSYTLNRVQKVLRPLPK